ncbi:hypothetical protein OKA05_03700 [Luteolibacter arcticus]|uniref:Uncharacterized protein n=1 Tax=Luteolibacter arcticus TaxID=1581411 RepID=A0ABT3GDD7_9BACT|nr:hypothetical protein [Luteolibacter arcticus]MCW1921642.1 hypothetical protein [Luteolibacter arcticus]
MKIRRLVVGVFSWTLVANAGEMPEVAGSPEKVTPASSLEDDAGSPAGLVPAKGKKGADGGLLTSRNATPTRILNLTPKGNIVFEGVDDVSGRDGKFWNGKRTMNLTTSSVWYDLFSADGKLVRRLPRHINVDPTGDPKSTDYSADDIHWRWLGDEWIIGVQEINYRGYPNPYEGVQREMTIPAPHGARIYLFNVSNLDIAYELKTPELPKGLAVHLDGITKDGYISLSGASPIAYHQGSVELGNDPRHFQRLGVFEIQFEK